VGFVLPGETAVVVGGVLASQGVVPLWAITLCAVLTAIIGDSTGYEVGRHVGPRVLETRLLTRHEARIGGARAYLAERGGWAIFAGRWVAFLRAVMPGLAGVSGMHYPRFLAWNALGGLAWGVTFTLIGYVAGTSFDTVVRQFGWISGGVVLALVVVVLLVHHLRRRRRLAASAQS
jgi:membrane-associated protein